MKNKDDSKKDGCTCPCHDGKHGMHEHGERHWGEYMKDMSKEELMMKKEKMEKKLAMVNKFLSDLSV